jgi:hypothetical protein
MVIMVKNQGEPSWPEQPPSCGQMMGGGQNGPRQIGRGWKWRAGVGTAEMKGTTSLSS